MLLDEFLPKYDFNEVHRVTVNAPAERVYRAVTELRPAELSPLVYWLLNLRKLPATLLGKNNRRKNLAGAKTVLEQLYAGGFIRLADNPDRHEAVFGLIGQFWKVSGGAGVQVSTPEAFRQFEETDYAKVAVNLPVQSMGRSSLLATETRI